MSDIAINIVKVVQEEALKEIEAEFVPETESIYDEKWSKQRSLVQKIKPEWKSEDRAVLSQLKRAAEETYIDIFDASFIILDQLYTTVRVPLRNHGGTVAKDPQGRTMWDTDEFGSYKENWSSLNNTEIDRALIKLQEHKFTISQRVRELFLETVFAKQSLQDDWHENFEKSVEGTTPLREARANRDTRDEKWRYFFNYYVWHMSDGFLKELEQTIALLTRIRDWRSR